MKLPKYFIIGSRPVKFVSAEDGGMNVLEYNWETGEFEYGMEYLSKVFKPGGEVEEVSEEEFNKYVKKLKEAGAKE